MVIFIPTALAYTIYIKIVRTLLDTSLFGNAGPFDDRNEKITTYSYEPDDICIPTNTKVVWINTDRISHTVTQENNVSLSETFNSGLIRPHSNHTHIFTSIGNYSYYDKKEDFYGIVRVLPTKEACDTLFKNLKIAEHKELASKYPKNRPAIK
ncbi:MAG TPA: hypothetical protein VH500_16530 [Nitrososphaeraceae archaeon]